MSDNRSNRPVSEEKTASASYIITFYQNVQQFTANYSQYLNFILIMEAKFKGVDIDKIDPVYKEQLVNISGQLRYFANACYIQFTTVAKHLKIEVDKELDKLQNEFETKLIIDRRDAKKYAIKLNEILANEVMKSLLVSSQSIIDSVYSENVNNTATSQ